MHSAFFDGRSRQNKMTLARDHRPTREAILADAQRAREKREQERRRQQAAGIIQCAVRRWQAEQAAVALYVARLDSIAAQHHVSASHSFAEPTHADADSVSPLTTAQLESIVVCFRYVQRHAQHAPHACLSRTWHCTHSPVNDENDKDKPTRAQQRHFFLEYYTGLVFHLVQSFVSSVIGSESSATPTPSTATQTQGIASASSLVTPAAMNVLKQLSERALVYLAECFTRDLLARAPETAVDAASLSSTNKETHLARVLAPWSQAAHSYTVEEVVPLLGVLADVADQSPPARWALGALVLQSVADAGITGAATTQTRASLLRSFRSLIEHGLSDLFPTPTPLTSLSALTALTTTTTPTAVDEEKAGTAADLKSSHRQAWSAALWDCLINTAWPQENMPLTSDVLTALWSLDSVGATDNAEGTQYDGRTRMESSCTALFSVAAARVTGWTPASHTASQMTVSGVGSPAQALSVLTRLTRLLPCLNATSPCETTASATPTTTVPALPEATRQLWLLTVSALTTQLSAVEEFINRILYDLHHSRTKAAAAAAAAASESLSYRYTISYLFSSEGGMQLLASYGYHATTLEAQAPTETHSNSAVNSAPCASSLPATADTTTITTAAAAMTTSLELCGGLFAWPLYTFSLSQEPSHHLEMAALFAKLARLPGLLRQLWCLYRDRSPGLFKVLVQTPETLAVRLAAAAAADASSGPGMYTAVTLPGLDAPASVLAALPPAVRQRRHLFYDASPALSVLFFALLEYYVGVTDFKKDLERGSVLQLNECTALILSLKDTVHRAHMNGVVPGQNGEAVAHLACTLLNKLHAVNESTPFLSGQAVWVSPSGTASVHLLGELTPSHWHELHAGFQEELAMTERRRAGSQNDSEEDADDDEAKRRRPPVRAAANEEAPYVLSADAPQRGQPGEDPLFVRSCFWRSDERLFRLLFHTPFLVPFSERGALLTSLLLNQPLSHGMHESQPFTVRRGAAFIDTYEHFHDRPDSTEMFQVRFRAANGDLEAGYGNGVYRELMSEVCNEGFSVAYGLFKQTDDGDVYPNPFSLDATDDADHLGKIAFLGTMAGRAIRDGIMQDVPFAHHFRNALLGRTNSINNLRRFDRELYEHLLKLLTLSEDDIASLELTFTYTVNALGITREVELIRDGANVPVTRRNCLHYIHLVADLKLNREGAQQTRAFQKGLEVIVHRTWLRLFDTSELNDLFCGEQGKMDVADWRRHTVYQSPDDVEHPAVRLFWQVVESLTAKQQSRLLQFTTAMKHPPLFGFRFLSPPFKIQLLKSDSVERLPSAATCFSTLKLPPYETFDAAKAKIVAAIEETNTFEFS